MSMCRAIRSGLPAQRYRHVLGVARTAARLAHRHGASPEKARIAALLHDIARGWPAAQLKAYARKHGLPVTPADETSPVLLHAAVGAEVARTEFGIEDEEVLGAIRRHTIALPGMTPLEKILYIADAVEPSRTYPERTKLAALGNESLDKGLLACLKSSLTYLMSREVPIDPGALALYNQLVGRREAAL
ncbi:MAG: bis(5'-nucleosyl)-tetraphosphatase (symmetrical) YqeK [Candidatus Eremiobacteraeota bacterium]|nr:bis(5'-nucleosyl)-tetraphosphatase (symmetrical) YqeK [Candidatus Eremiobacteraeota bacterium]